jgi:Na+-transporting methylmalonyl-CoA/oxaloacetate decarboxylase gamma subunit
MNNKYIKNLIGGAEYTYIFIFLFLLILMIGCFMYFVNYSQNMNASQDYANMQASQASQESRAAQVQASQAAQIQSAQAAQVQSAQCRSDVDRLYHELQRPKSNRKTHKKVRKNRKTRSVSRK